jgi:hypothetical protein
MYSIPSSTIDEMERLQCSSISKSPPGCWYNLPWYRQIDFWPFNNESLYSKQP